jgi:polyisoprenoid-binding protein YceI
MFSGDGGRKTLTSPQWRMAARRGSRHERVAALLCGVALLAGLCSPGLVLGQSGPAFRVTQGDVRVTVPLRPGGAFEARTASLSGTLTLASPSRPAELEGELVSDLTTIDTGIDLRNRHLRENYLEVSKGPGYDKAVLSQIRLADAAGADFAGRTAFTGTLRLHNVSKPVSGTAEVRRSGSGVEIVATFPLLLPDFGIEPPQYMGVGVGNKLMVKVSFQASPGGAR